MKKKKKKKGGKAIEDLDGEDAEGFSLLFSSHIFITLT